LRLAEDVPNIQGVKESSGNLQQIAELIHMLPPSFTVLAGDDVLALPVIAVGGAGLISVASNEIPAEMARMVVAALDGDWATARALNRRYFRLLNANFWDSSPGPVKCVMAMMGRLQENYRLPIVPVSKTTREKLKMLAEELGLLRKS
jgi:4-hydroxy-tetrahydrodipicolinate synthase